MTIYNDSYIFYGLNRRRYFLNIPRCDDCGEPMKIIAETEEELEEFSIETLKEHDCLACALFYVRHDGTYEAFIKTMIDNNEDDDEDEIRFAVCKVHNSNRHLFAETDAEFRLCCYSLLIEVEDGVYEVCS